MEYEDSWTDPSIYTPKLPLLSIAPIWASPEHPGMLTPPLRTIASIPFQWEEEPGKPRPCTALIPFPTSQKTEPKSLELPPRLLFQESHKINAKSSSPVTVLDGPYLGRPKFVSSSFRLSRERQMSFDSSGSRSPEYEKVHIGSVVLGGKKLDKNRGFFGSWKRKSSKVSRGGRNEFGSSSFVYPSSMESSSFLSEGKSWNRIANVKKVESFNTLSNSNRSHFWATVYEGIKQVIPWKSKNSKKGFYDL